MSSLPNKILIVGDLKKTTMELEYTNLYTTILGSLVVAILTGMFATLIRSIKKTKEINPNSSLESSIFVVLYVNC